MIVYNNQAPNNVNNVGQFGATEGSIGAYKQAAEYAADAKYWALLSQTKYNSVEDILAEVERLYAQGYLLEEDIKQLKEDFEAQEQVLLGLIQSTNTAIDNTNAATELSKEATQDVLAQLDIISNMTVQTTLLPPGSMATGSYDNSTGVFAFGIPEGQPGRDGTDGTISDIGSVAVGVPVSDDYGFYVDKDNGGLYRASMSDIANLVPSIRSISINGGEEQTGDVFFNSVSSFNNRTGDIVAQTGDYEVGQITGAAKSGANSDITSLSGLTTALSVSQGGTGATTPENSRTNLGLGSVSVENVVPLVKGGTGAITPSAARTNLGLGLVSTESIVPITKGGTGATSAMNARLALVAAKSGENSDITSFTNSITFTQPINIPDGIEEGNAVTVGQLNAVKTSMNTYDKALWRHSLAEVGMNLVTGSFEEGGTLNSYTDVLLDVTNQRAYSWAGTYPKVVAPGSAPTDPQWTDRTSLTLRAEIFNNYIDFETPEKHFIAGEADWTGAFERALAVNGRVQLMGKTYDVQQITTSVDDIYLIGQGSSATKIRANKTGAYLLKIGGSLTNLATVRERISVQSLTLDGNNKVTNTFITCASQSPDFINDVVVTGAISHGMVHTRGWSTFARGLVCRNNGGGGLRLEGDNNNTHWEGMWSHNTGIGLYIRNAAAVTVKGSIENNGEQGAIITATATIPTGFMNIESSVVSLIGVYAESNSLNANGVYADIQFGGNDGIVRDCSLVSSHIGVRAGNIGVQISQNVQGLYFDTVGIYPVGGESLAHIRFSGAYASMPAILAAGFYFKNINAATDKIIASGFTDTDSDVPAFVFGGGNQCYPGKSRVIKNFRVSDTNNLGTYLEHVYRGSELISECGIKPNVQLWYNAVSSAGYHSFAIGGYEKLRMNRTNFQPRSDNNINLGAASTRWGTVYAGTGTINTSDERLKIVHVDDNTEAEALAAREIKSSIYRFKFADSVSIKGERDARIHFGVGAQTVAAILTKHGLRPEDYAFWCHDTWDDERDAEGNVTITAGDRYGIRYDELSMFILSYC